MSILDPASSGGFSEPEENWKRKMGWFWLALFALIGVWGIMQTQLFVSCLPHPSLEDIRQHITQSNDVQSHLGEKSKTPPERKINLHGLFNNDAQRHSLEDAITLLSNDRALQDELKRKFGHSYEEINVVIIPAWVLEKPLNYSQLGITDEGGEAAKGLAGDPNIDGFTLRDRYPNLKPWTLNGTPRIALNLEAFQSRDTLELTLFHELLHAENVPGHDPPAITILQNDLVYLPEYRANCARLHLNRWHEPIIWTVWVIVPWGVFGFLLYRRLPALRGRLMQVP